MSIRTKRIIGLVVLFSLGLILAACQAATQVTAPTQAPNPIVIPTCPAVPACPTASPAEQGVDAPFEEEWAASPHNDAESLAFTDWDETEDKMVPATCAKCHSTTGYHDFLGVDGSEAGKVDKPAPIGTTVTCDACHNQVTATMSSVTFLSGVEVTGLGPEARCMVCHQGRATKAQVDAQIERFAAEDLDAVVEPIKEGENTVNFGFINVHYYAAAITLYGTEVKGGYEYEGKVYDAKFDHVEGYDSCVGCHNPHTTEVKVDQCAQCHEGVASTEDIKNIRMISSAPDYDGDGDAAEGMVEEMNTMRETLYGAIQAYANDVIGTGIVYDEATHPYFFTDADGDGTADKNAEGANLRYSTWTPRLLKAAYNFQVSIKDPGAHAHGNKYIIQLMYDSIENLNEKLATPVDMSAMARDDAGHFAGNTMAFRDWDDTGLVPAACSKCHSATGLPQFLAEGTTIRNPTANGFLCSTCHDEANWPANYAIKEVTFPSGAKVSFGEGDANNLCLSCHQGRESTVSVDNALKAFTNQDEASDQIRFRNVHYFAAGATLFGSEVKGIYQYAGKEYVGRFEHVDGFNTCTACHDAHVLAPNTEACAGCHNGAEPEDIRSQGTTEDFDGDGDVTEGLKGEVDTYAERLYATIQDYAKTRSKGILYDAHAYPYFFLDADGDGKADVNAEGAPQNYNAFTPNLMRAAYNYQYVQKDPGAFVHNARYVMQAMYDSIQSLGGDLTGLVRP